MPPYVLPSLVISNDTVLATLHNDSISTKLPEKFNGQNLPKLDDWLLSCSIYFMFNHTQLSTAAEKVIFAFSRMDGYAREKIKPFIKDFVNNQDGGCPATNANMESDTITLFHAWSGFEVITRKLFEEVKNDECIDFNNQPSPIQSAKHLEHSTQILSEHDGFKENASSCQAETVATIDSLDIHQDSYYNVTNNQIPKGCDVQGNMVYGYDSACFKSRSFDDMLPTGVGEEDVSGFCEDEDSSVLVPGYRNTAIVKTLSAVEERELNMFLTPGKPGWEFNDSENDADSSIHNDTDDENGVSGIVEDEEDLMMRDLLRTSHPWHKYLPYGNASLCWNDYCIYHLAEKEENGRYFSSRTVSQNPSGYWDPEQMRRHRRNYISLSKHDHPVERIIRMITCLKRKAHMQPAIRDSKGDQYVGEMEVDIL